MKVITLLFALILSSCATMSPIDTNEKRLAAAEITWKQTLITVNKNVNRMTPEQKASVKQTLIDANSAIKAARLALAVSNDIDFTNNIAVVNTSIDILRNLLEQLEEAQNGFSIQRHNFA